MVAEELDELVRLVDDGVLVAIVGPTASGKTELASRLAARVGGEVVSADSVQVYRRFDLGSGKPTAAEREATPHHLVDVAEPAAPIDAARYAALASEAIEAVRARGKHPIVCGGTFLWVKALLYGLSDAPPADPEIRARHEARVAAEGAAALHRALAAVDPPSAARLHPNDTLRVGRALEVFEVSGRTMSDFQAAHAFGAQRHRAQLVARRLTPEALTENIARRVDGWLEAGWIDEVRQLLDEGYGETRPMGSVGYREVAQHVKGGLPLIDLAPAVVRSTRVFARRQRTWLARADVLWFT